MELNDLWIRPCTNIADVRDFIVANHYSHSISGITTFMAFEVVLKSDYQKQVGAAVFGISGQMDTELLYGEYEGSKQTHRPKVVCVELRRFALLDELPPNSASWLLSRMLQKLGNLGVDRVISYADPNEIRPDHKYGKHTGLMYTATGFHRVRQVKTVYALTMVRDHTMEGKTFAKGRRIPVRNRDQYKNFRGVSPESVSDDKYPNFLADWQENLATGKSKTWRVRRSSKNSVFIIKIDKYLTSLSRRLRDAEKVGAAVPLKEEGKILHIKDLRKGLKYFETPEKA